MKQHKTLLLLAIAVATGATGCAEHLDTTRVVPERMSLGAEIYKVMCQRVAIAEIPEDVSGQSTNALCEGNADPDDGTPPRLRALADNRTRLVAALDQVLPEELQDDLRDFLFELLPLYDAPRDRLPRQARATADMLSRLVEDPQVLTALARMSTRQGYRPTRLALGVARPVLAYPDFDDFAGTTLATIDEGGAAATEWDAVLRALSLEMATAPTGSASPTSGESTLRIARNLLFTEDDAFGTATPRFVVLRDSRGIAMPDPATGVIAPFVDMDLDGLADVDAFGRYTNGRGGLLSVPTPFATLHETGVARDSRGRAIRPDATRYYGYVDADRTLLAAMMREARPWLDPSAPTALDLAYATPVLLGPRRTRTETIGRATLDYDGFDTSRGPLFDLIYAAGTVLDRNETTDAIAATNALTRDREDAVAGLIDAALGADHRADLHPEARLEQPSIFWDDVLAVSRKIAQHPGMMEAIMRALADPRARHLGQVYARFMRNKNDFDLDASNINNPPIGDFTIPVDRSRPDDAGNLSVWQRFIALFHDMSGVRLCNKEGAYLSLGGVKVWPLVGTYHECEMFEIDNMAEFLNLAVVGRAELVLKPEGLRGILDVAGRLGLNVDDTLAALSGIDGMGTHPTAQALSRFAFGPRNEFCQNLIDPPRTRDGVLAEERYGHIIFAAEKEMVIDGDRVSFNSSMMPLYEVFADFDPAGGDFLFGEVFSALHTHWSSRSSSWTQRSDPRAPFFDYQDNLVGYEDLVAEDLAEGQLFTRASELVTALNSVQARPGVDGTRAMATAAEMMVDASHSPGLEFRDGRIHPCRNDGLCNDGVSLRNEAVAPIDVILDALGQMDRAFDAEPARHERWLAARGRMVDQLLTTRRNGSGNYELADRRAYAALRVLIPFLQDRIAAHTASGDLTTWAHGLTGRAETTIGSALAAALIDFVNAAQNDSESREQISRLAQYLMDESGSNPPFDTTLVAAADLLQVLEDERTTGPLLQGLSSGIAQNARDVARSGGTIDLDNSALDESLLLLRSLRDVDSQHVMRQVMSRLVAPPPGTQETPVETIVDVIAEVNRANPGAGGAMDSDDFESVLGKSRDFMGDHDHGMERMFDIVQARELDR